MFRFFFILVLSPVICQSQQTLSGHVYDAASGEGLIGATIRDEVTGKGTTTNAYGFYSLTVPADSLLLKLSYVGYQTLIDTVDHKGSSRRNFHLLPKTETLQQVVVVSDRDAIEREVHSTKTGVFELAPKEATVIPGIGGEADVLKVVQLMPGVSKGGEGTTALYVRGGTDDQNLVTLDEATVYNVGHLFGFFSVFNTDALRNVNVIKGGFPANYGGRLSAVMDMRMQEGHPSHLEGKGGVGLLTSRLTLDGPIVKDKASFMVAGRRTYIDQVFRLVNIDLPYYFYDLNTKANVKITERDRLFVSGYFGNDVLRFRESAESEGDLEALSFGFNLGNFTSTIRWNHIYPGEKLFSNITLLQTRFKYDIRGDFVGNSLLIRSQIQDIGLRGDWEYFRSPEERLDFGFNTITHLFRPNVVNTSGEITSFLRSREGKLISTQENAVYGGIEKNWTPSLITYAGIRLSSSIVTSRAYAGIEPRLNLTFRAFPLFSVKGSYARMKQYMHRVSSSSIVLPTDLWYPVTATVRPQSSDQWSLGMFKGIPDLQLSVSLEGYYKIMRNLIEYREGARLLLNDNFERELVSGTGRSYGAEFLIRRKSGALTGWVAYTLSRSTRNFPDLNQGLTYPARYDRRHDLSVVGMLRLTEKVEFSWVWVFTSGSAFTPQTGQYLQPSPTLDGVEIVPIYSSRNAIKLSPTHRLDLNFVIKNKPRGRFQGEWQFSAYNFYNRASPYVVTIRSNGQAFRYVQPGLFGFIPAVSYNFSF